MKIEIESLDWQKNDGLIPAIIQDENSLQVLMLGYMNKEALKQTIETGLVTFFSRTKNRLWQKGETSGNALKLVDVVSDCDNDSLLIVVNPRGPACHLGRTSCFDKEVGWLAKLQSIIDDRYQNRNKDSYTSSLFDKGISYMAQKVGEEAVETTIAAVSDDENFTEEVSDLLYHLFVLLRAKEIKFSEIIEVLKKRGG